MIRIFALLILVCSLNCSAEDIKYHINDMLTISVSDKMEMRMEDDAYTKWMNNVFDCTSEGKIVFQQKGLSDFDPTARTQYARIIIKTEVDEECSFPTVNDVNIPGDVVNELEDACTEELAPGQSFLTIPKGKVERLKSGVRIKIGYRRSGVQGAVCVQVIYIFNYRYAAKIIASYRESEESIWQIIIEQAINSIKWDEPFFVESLNHVIPQNEHEFITEEKSTDNNGVFIGLFVGFLLMICIFLTYHLYQAKIIEHQKKEQKEFIEDAGGKADLLISNELDKAGNSYEKFHVKKGSQNLDRAEKLGNPNTQTSENIPIERKNIIKESKCNESRIQIQSVKSNVHNILNEKDNVCIDNEKQQELEIINNDYQYGIIPEQRILQTNYSIPYVKQYEGAYCFTLFPEPGTTLFPFRRRRIEKRGFTEAGFEKKLIISFAQLINYRILSDVSILPVNDVHPYELDIAIIEKENHLGIRIDIEIDEPYTGYEHKPIHYIGCGDEYRDANLCNLGWIVIRFSEKQVYTEAEKCISYVKYILSLIDKSLSGSDIVLPRTDKRWTSTEAVIMAAKGYRESYLHHQFNKTDDCDDTRLTISDIKQTELEKEAAKQVQTVALPQNRVLNIDNSVTEYIHDVRIGFEPKEHIYILDGVHRLKAVSDVVAHFFYPFDILTQSERYAFKNGMSQTEVIEMWDAKGVESRDIGIFLHEQIESYLKGGNVSFDYSFSYDGELVNYKKTISIKKEFSYFLDFIRDSGVKPFRSEWRIFDEENKIAGTIDLICRNDSQFDIYDWKRSVKASPNAVVWKHGRNGLEHIPDIAFYKYALQQNLYKFILENNYDIKINKMYLIVLHHEYDRYIKYEIPQMDKEINIIINSLQFLN